MMKKSKTLFSALFFLTALFAGTQAFADEGGYYIKNFDVQSRLSKNNEITVTETIDVVFTEERHGIYRFLPDSTAFPYEIEDCEGDLKKLNIFQRLELKFNNVLVLEYPLINKLLDIDDPCNVYTENDCTVFKIGSAGKYISGDKQYVITYKITIPDDRFPYRDLLYHSILGPSWNVPIEKFTFCMDFEEPIYDTSNFILHSGKAGSHGNNLNVEYTITPSRVYGHVENIEPNCAINFYSPLPEGYYENEWKNGRSKVLLYILSFLTIISSAIFIIVALKTDREKPVQTVEFYPPEGISASEVGYIIDGKVDNEDLFCLIPYFAQQGNLQIIEVPKKNNPKKIDHIELKQLKGLYPNAPKYQQTIFKALFRYGKTVNLDKLGVEFGEKMKKAKSELKKEFDGDKELYAGEFTAFFAYVVPSVLSAFFYFNNTASGIDNYLAVFPPIVNIFCGWCLNKFSKAKLFKKFAIVKTFVFLAVELFVSYFFVADSCLDPNLNWVLTMFTLLVPIAAVILSPYCVHMTDYNREVTGKLLGLKEFIKLAEVPKLKELIATDASYFFNVLPYAMVFRLTGRWAKHFTDINIPKPLWYNGTDTIFQSMFFANYFDRKVHAAFGKANFSSNVANIAATLASAASSGGGGSSGGGSGGGGGGSW